VECDALRDDQWERLCEFAPGRKREARSRHGQSAFSQRAALDGSLGCTLARPSGHLGDYETVKRPTYRWIEMSVLDGILEALAREADPERLMTDSIIVRAHEHAAGARRQKGA
jgi:hypothetical protein